MSAVKESKKSDKSEPKVAKPFNYIGKYAPKNIDEVKMAWWAYHGYTWTGIRNYCPVLLKLALKMKYIQWPWKIKDYFFQKDVLDLGCGRSLHGIGFLLAGASSYVGLDPRIKLDEDGFKDPRKIRSGFRNPIGWTPRKITRRIPLLKFHPSYLEAFPVENKKDVLVMHNVTEHLMEIESTFAGFPAHLKEGGLLIFSHPNFYSWAGHHMPPRTLDEIDLKDPAQAMFIDWKHLEEHPDWPKSVRLSQNRIRLHELRAVVEKDFEILKWEPRESDEKQGALRFHDSILEKHPQFSREELLTQSVLCVARKRAGI